MAKQAEKDYYKNIGKDGVSFSAGKPYSDRVNAGALLTAIGSIYSVINNEFAQQTVRILDLGCGTGWSSNMFALAGHEVVGGDLSVDAIKAAKSTFKGLKNLTFKQVDYENLTSLGKFDVAIFIDALHHADDEAKVLKNVAKVLNNGGICIVCEPGKGHGSSPDALEAIRLYGVNERDMPPKIIKRAAKQAGFTKIKTMAHPALVQKSFYKEFKQGKKGAILSSGLGRFLAQLFVATLGKTREGLVVLYK